LLHQVGDLFELNVKLRCQKVKEIVFVRHSDCVFRDTKLNFRRIPAVTWLIWVILYKEKISTRNAKRQSVG